MGCREGGSCRGSVLGLMTAGLSSYRSDYVTQAVRLTGAHRDCTHCTEGWSWVQSRCTGSRESFQVIWCLFRRWTDCDVTVTWCTRHTPRPIRSRSCDNTQNCSHDRESLQFNSIWFLSEARIFLYLLIKYFPKVLYFAFEIKSILQGAGYADGQKCKFYFGCKLNI